MEPKIKNRNGGESTEDSETVRGTVLKWRDNRTFITLDENTVCGFTDVSSLVSPPIVFLDLCVSDHDLGYIPIDREKWDENRSLVSTVDYEVSSGLSGLQTNRTGATITVK